MCTLKICRNKFISSISRNNFIVDSSGIETSLSSTEERENN